VSDDKKKALAEWARATVSRADFRLDLDFLKWLARDTDGLGARYVWRFDPPRGFSVQECAAALVSAMNDKKDRAPQVMEIMPDPGCGTFGREDLIRYLREIRQTMRAIGIDGNTASLVLEDAIAQLRLDGHRIAALKAGHPLPVDRHYNAGKMD